MHVERDEERRVDHITSGASGSGNGTVAFTVAANPGASRNGTIVVAGQTFTITQ